MKVPIAPSTTFGGSSERKLTGILHVKASVSGGRLLKSSLAMIEGRADVAATLWLLHSFVKAFVTCGDKDSDTYRDLTGSWTRPPLHSLATVVSGLGGSTESGRGHNSSIVGTIGSLSFDKMIYSPLDGSEDEEVADRAFWNVFWKT